MTTPVDTSKKTKKNSVSTILLVVVVLGLIISGLVWRTGNTPLDKIYIESKFPTGDIQNFQTRLDEIEAQENFSGVVEWARMYDYIGYPGKAIQVYENRMVENEAYRATYNNIGKLYEKVCEVDEKVNKKYCLEALKYYDILITEYLDSRYLLDKSHTYFKMGDVATATELYKEYFEKTGGRESRYEEDLGITDEDLAVATGSVEVEEIELQ